MQFKNNAIFEEDWAGFLRGVPLGEWVGGGARPERMRWMCDADVGRGFSPKSKSCKKVINLVFVLRFWKLKNEKVSLLKIRFLHYPFCGGF